MTELVYLICDESGAKGYDDKPEVIKGELGVMAGFLVPHRALPDVRARLGSIAWGFSQTGKLHITDLSAEQQADLRSRIFSYLSAVSGDAPCLLYEAIHRQGFHEWGETVRDAATKARAARRSSVAISAHESKDRLHSALFTGLFSKAVVFVVDQFGWEAAVNVVVITDRIDEPIRREFHEAALRLLGLGGPETRTVKGYDRHAGHVVEGQIRTAARGIETDFSRISFDIVSEDTPLTLAADVPANSVAHHLGKSRPEAQLGASLNTKAAIAGHPLERHFYACWDETMGDAYAADALYMHPLEGRRSEAPWLRRIVCTAWQKLRRLWS